MVLQENMEKRKEARQLNNWQKITESVIISGLRARKTDDEILIELGKRKMDLSYLQFRVYRKRAMMKLKNRG